MKNLKLFLIIFVALIALASAAQAAENINLRYNTSTHIRFSRNITRVFVGSQRIVTVKQPTSALNEIVITALERTGSTNIFVWTAEGAQHEYIVTVYDDQRGEAAIIEREIGLPNVHVKKIGGRVLLTGTVADENQHQHAVRIAQFFAGGAVTSTNETEGASSQANVIDNLQVLNPFSKNTTELQIERVIGLPNVNVKKIGEKILLQGTVENEDEHQHALNVAAMFLENNSSTYTSTFDTSANPNTSSRRTRVGAQIVDELIVLNPYSKTTIETQIEQAINIPSVQVKKIGNSVMLSGTVDTEREHIHAVQVATVFANNADIDNNTEMNNNVKIMGYESVNNANVSKINIVDRIEVLNSKTILEEKIEQAIGLPNVSVKKIDDRLLLTGTVKNQYERNYAIQIARLFIGGGTESSLNFGSNVSPSLHTQSSTSTTNTTLANDDKVQDDGKIIDLLQMTNPLQIRLEAQVVEINSDKARDFGITYGETGSGGTFSMGENNDRTGGDPTAFRHNPITWMEQRFGAINTTIHALVSDGKARILSRPNVMTMSGEQATIQIGGEIPYTVQTSDGPSTRWKDYGIILQFKPIIDAQNRIVTAFSTEVSNLSGQTVDSQPIISTRRADSVVTLDSGSTIVIGGLMDSSESKTVSKIPLLGNIPILGEFFKYTSKTKDKRELIILVTPRIVGEEDAGQTYWSPTMREWYGLDQKYREAMERVDFNRPKAEDESSPKVDKPFADK